MSDKFLLYPSAAKWQSAKRKRVLLFAMSGLGKTHVSSMLRAQGSWFHYSIDYRIGTHYMGDYIVDNFKEKAMKDPFLAHLLRSDSIYIASNITFDNLYPLSTYLGKPGDETQGGIAIDEYMRRQQQHQKAEIGALMDTEEFIEKAQRIYGYAHFICDTSGSICEVVDPNNPNDPVLRALSKNLLMVWIKGTEDHTAELIRRFDKAPKPMCYQAHFLQQAWQDYLTETGTAADKVNPDDFVRWTYARALGHRQPLYEAMSKWGITVTAQEMKHVKTPADFDALIGRALDAQGA